MSARDEFELIVVGHSPAALAAAIRARNLKRSVLVIESPDVRLGGPPLTWVNAAAMGLCHECGVKPGELAGISFCGLHLHSGDLKRASQLAKEKDLKGWVCSAVRVGASLLQSAAKAGCAHRSETVRLVCAGDESVELTLSDRGVVRGRAVVVDDGVESPVAGMFRIVPASRTPHACPLVFEAIAAKSPAGVRLVLGPSRCGNLGVILSDGEQIQIGLLMREAGADGAAGAFSAFRTALTRAGLVPDERGQTGAVICPAGAALDMDTHVGKRMLLIGDAGGFASAFSGDALWPGLRSGIIGAETAIRAIDAAQPQDELVSFDAAWRTDLADYLRMPNTDLSLLMPLVFNESLQMSRRVGRAFLLGEKF